MTINATNQMQQMGMQGAHGKGNGQHGMKDIMQSLSQEDRTQLREKMSSLSMEDRKDAIAQMKEVDKTNPPSGDYLASLLDIISTDKKESSEQSTGFSIYA